MTVNLSKMAFRNVNIRVVSLFRCNSIRKCHDTRKLIGEREIVGHGINSQPYYLDNPSFPFPAIRYKEPTPEILALREKEKGDWRNLTIDEKKCLYRATFCQTFAEINAPTGEWKSTVGLALVCISLAAWVYMAMKLFVYAPLPDSFAEENQKAQLKRMIDLEVNPITGLASKWDYKNERWK
ncbi:Cytochrome c oxidase subunit 4 [Carabus blaptoides fortunei]